MRNLMSAALVASLLSAACFSPEVAAPDDNSWVGTITTEGDVTTVVNQSGSIWGGSATLVEEASIGVDVGDDPYMLGVVEGFAAHNGRIYVLDRQVPALRVYDFGGRHVADIGGKGAGPGEFDVPFGVAVAPDGRVFVRDTAQGRINVYGENGEPVATWPFPATFFSSQPMVVTRDGILYALTVIAGNPGSPDRQLGLRGYKPDGSLVEDIPEPEFDFEPRQVTIRRGSGSTGSRRVPFSAAPAWTLAPSGAMISGVGDEYRYEVRYPDGATRVVRREITRVPIDSAEADWAWADFRQKINRQVRDGGTIEGADPGVLPEYKPAFRQLIAGQEGRVWVRRVGKGRYLPNCGGSAGDDPCWRSARGIDVFDGEGRFLGELEIPEEMSLQFPEPYVRGNTIIAGFESSAGTVMVKRYRLVPPE